MSDENATQLMPSLPWRDPRVHLLDDAWLLTIFAVLFAIAVPWLVSGLAIDFLPTAAGLIVLGLIHVAFAALAQRATVNGRRRTRGLLALQALGVLALAYIWPHAGGLQNPVFLMVFALPVVGAIFLSRWHPYAVALLTALLVAVVAAAEAPELRWYVPGLNQVLGWTGSLAGSSTGLPFAGFYAPPEYFLVVLEVFLIMLCACAIAAEYLGSVFERLHTQVGAALGEAERGQRLWSTLLEQLPLPAVLVDANTAEIIYASSAARAQFGFGEAGRSGHSLFDALRFSYPEIVQELINGAGGVTKPCMVHLGEKLLATEVRVQHLAQKGRRFALLIISDLTEAFCVRAALDVADQAALVVEGRGRVLAFNKPASALFPALEVDSELPRLLPQPDESRWWDPGLSGRRKMHVTIAQRVYQVTLSSVPLPGEADRLYVVAFLPAARVAAATDQSGTYTTLAQRP